MSGDFAGDLGLIPGQGTRSHMLLQLGVYMPQLGPGAPNTLKKKKKYIYIYIYVCVCVCVCVCVWRMT